MIKAYPRVQRYPEELVASYRKVSPSTIGHLTDRGFMLGLSPLKSPTRLAGTAVTVRIPHMDSAAVHIAVDLLRPGDVLVVSTSGDVARACFGGMVGFAVHVQRAAGAVIDGMITDRVELEALDISIFSRGVGPITTRNLGIEGEVNVPISVAGAVVLPGDIILGDENGVMVIPNDQVLDLARVAAEKEAAEPRTRERVAAGEALKDLSGAARHAQYLEGPAGQDR